MVQSVAARKVNGHLERVAMLADDRTARLTALESLRNKALYSGEEEAVRSLEYLSMEGRGKVRRAAKSALGELDALRRR
ncbi:MAG: hypothetical protein KGH72_01355 [Candidatus Micrarchaeota archaeon]|nr:hypothetical protein [Candidatus Micrarchaeota archaeon]